jgi:predicted RNA-binding Zn-ribbon protein involved in translation (DUF1610 family)
MSNENAESQNNRVVLKTGTFLKCQCPFCGKSLITDDWIALEVVNQAKERGVLRLSPYLNFFDASSTIQLADWQEVLDLNCPHCHHSLKEPGGQCASCRSNIARLMVKAGAEPFDFLFCLRKNCRWHGLSEEAKGKIILEASGFEEPKDHKEFIKSGTKLHLYCPLCKAGLVEGDHLIVHVRDSHGKLSELKLSPYLNVFTSECSIFLPPGEEVCDMFCPKCNQNLWVDEKRCEACGARAARFMVKAFVLDVDFYICMRIKCHWHGLGPKDRQRIILDESLEW